MQEEAWYGNKKVILEAQSDDVMYDKKRLGACQKSTIYRILLSFSVVSECFAVSQSAIFIACEMPSWCCIYTIERER